MTDSLSLQQKLTCKQSTIPTTGRYSCLGGTHAGPSWVKGHCARAGSKGHADFCQVGLAVASLSSLLLLPLSPTWPERYTRDTASRGVCLLSCEAEGW